MKNALKFFLALAAMLLIMLAVRAWAFTIYQVTNSDLQPEVRKGDRMMVNRLGSAYQKGNIIVFGKDSSWIGRVEAVPGDTINLEKQNYRLPTECVYCGSTEQCYYLVDMGKMKTLVRHGDIIGTAFRIWPFNR